MTAKAELSPEQRGELLSTLQIRFEANMHRHQGLAWSTVRARLEANPEKLWSLSEMESTGGAPDVVGLDQATGAYVFYDCSAESPAGRRSLCYDRAALDARKANKPENSAVDMAAAIGIELLTEAQYRATAAAWRIRYKNVELGRHTGQMSESSAAPSSVTAALTRSSSITTARIPTTLPAASAVRCWSEDGS